MNTLDVQQLLDQWEVLLDVGKKIAIEKANINKDGLQGRITRTTGVPVVFDFGTYQVQNRLQICLCRKTPQFTNLICSQPELMTGYAWIREDFIDLYFEHYCIVVEKLRRLTKQAAYM